MEVEVITKKNLTNLMGVLWRDYVSIDIDIGPWEEFAEASELVIELRVFALIPKLGRRFGCYGSRIGGGGGGVSNDEGGGLTKAWFSGKIGDGIKIMKKWGRNGEEAKAGLRMKLKTRPANHGGTGG